ncbi:hypothetical protein JCM3774_000178 [Rhodotorula dairenensis]
MQATQASDAALLRRSSLAAAVDAAPPMSAAHHNHARGPSNNGHSYLMGGRESAYSDHARSQDGRYPEESTANRPSLADWGHTPSAPVQGSSKWAEVSSSANAQRPTSVPLPSETTDRGVPAYPHHLQQQQQQPQPPHHQQRQQPTHLPPQPYMSMSRLQQQWSKTTPPQYAPYRMPGAPEPARHVLPNSTGEGPRMPSYGSHQPDPYSARPSQAVPSYSFAPSSHQATSQSETPYSTPLSLTLPPLTSSFSAEPFALTSTYGSTLNDEQSHYTGNGAASYGLAHDALQQAGTALRGHIPTLGEVYAKTRPPAPLTTSMPRQNNADSKGYADDLSSSIPAGSAQPNSRKRKEPKDAASRKYHCSECEQKFARPSALATHILTHTREKPFVCTTCNRGFAVMSNLRRHCRVRSHALAPNQESTVKRDRTDSQEAASRSNARKGREASPEEEDDHASADETVSHSLPPALPDPASSSFTLPAQHIYPP